MLFLSLVHVYGTTYWYLLTLTYLLTVLLTFQATTKMHLFRRSYPCLTFNCSSPLWSLRQLFVVAGEGLKIRLIDNYFSIKVHHAHATDIRKKYDSDEDKPT